MCGLVPDLSSEGTLSNLVAVLCSHTNFSIKLGPGKVKVNGRSATDHICKNSLIRNAIQKFKSDLHCQNM